MHTALMAFTSYEAKGIVANSRKHPLEAWRRLQKLHDPTLDDEIKLAGLEALVPEELEKHSILNSNRSRIRAWNA